MKLSKLIAELTRVHQENGDMEVYYEFPDGDGDNHAGSCEDLKVFVGDSYTGSTVILIQPEFE